MANKTKVLIVGGGFGGLKTLLKLANNNNFEITLITDQETFRYGATIWRATTGYLKNASYIPITGLVPLKPNVKLIIDSVTKIDRSKKSVVTEKGNIYKYDYCVLALGVVTSYFGIKGLEEYSYSVKSSSAFDKFREHLHNELVEEKALDKNYVVVGAGPTGVELAAALKSYLKTVAKHHKVKDTSVNMDLVEAAPKILPMLSDKSSKLTQYRLHRLGVKIMTSTVVKGETKDRLKIGDKSIPTHTVIWTAGVTNNSFFETNKDQFKLNEKKRVIVDETLRVDKHTFVIGDCAGTKYSGLALTALHNANYVAKSIKSDIAGKNIKAYKPLKPVTIIPIGDDWAIFEWRSVILSGKLASVLRTIYDFVGYSEIMGVKKAFNIWLKRNKTHEDCPFCEPAKS